MSALLGVFSRDGRPLDDALLERLLEPLRGMGSRRLVARPDAGAALAVVRHDWEEAEGLAGPPEVVERGELFVAADASLYYRQDLCSRLAMRRVRGEGTRPAHLLAAAYQAWGEQCAGRLEGDFAFMVYDRARRSVFCARDFTGRRPLFYAELGDTLVVASRVAAIRAHPDCRPSLNLAVVGVAAANMSWSIGSDTVYSAVRVVPMAGSLSWRGEVRIWRHWSPDGVEERPGVAFEQAAGELRETLARAVTERLAPRGVTAVWMSGGRDSTAVFGAGRHGLRTGGSPGALRPVSISYPPGDSGREDEIIEAVAKFWDTPVHWLDIADIRMFDRDAERAADRDEPTTSPYELWNVALAEATGACPARIGLDGNGGDQLFTGTDVYLSDLLSRGHWLTLARALRRHRQRGWRHLLSATFAPALPGAVAGLLARARRRSGPGHYLENPVPTWLRRDFVEREGLRERERAHLPESRPGRHAVAEMRWTLSLPVVGYMQGLYQRRFLEVGVEMRSPLLDRRVVELALRRPWFERFAGIEKKALLRASMRGSLPPAVLAERPWRTGTTLSYSRRAMQARLVPLYEEIAAEPLRLAELGVVEPAALRGAVEGYRRGDDEPRIALYHTLQTELWLRARGGSGL